MLVKVLLTVIFMLFAISGIVPSFAQTTSGFTNAVRLSDVSYDSHTPSILVSNDGVFAIWMGIQSGRSDIFFAKSADGGNTFGAPINLSADTHGQSAYAAFAQKGKDVYVVWQTSLTGTADVYLAKSTDGGDTFGKPVLISDSTKLAAFPQLAVSDNHVYFSWLEMAEDNSTNIVFAKSDDGANTIGNLTYMTSHSGNSGLPKLVATGSQVYLVWEDNSQKNFEIYLRKSNDYGSTFDTPVDISTSSGQSGTPQIVVSNDKVYAVWMDDTSGNFDILFAKSSDGGKSFGAPVNISKLHTDSGYPQLAVSGDNVYVTWTQTIVDPNYDVYFVKSTDGGNTFDEPVNVSKNLGPSGWPHIAADGAIYISWVDSSPGKFDLYITKSTDGGATFQNYTNVSNSKTESYNTQMALLNDVVYLAWEEGAKSNYTIMFNKSTTFVPEFGPLAAVALLVSIGAIIAVSSRSNLRNKF